MTVDSTVVSTDITPVTIIPPTGVALYTPVLATASAATVVRNQAVLFFNDGVNDAVAENAIAVGATNNEGIVIPGVALQPGLIYRVTTPDYPTTFGVGRFCAPGIVGPVIVPGDNVSGA